MTIKKVYKLTYVNQAGASKTLSLPNPIDGIDGTTLGNLTANFAQLGITVQSGQYIVTQTSEKVLPVN